MNTTLSQRIKDAESLIKQGKLREAKESFSALLQEYPENPNILSDCNG
jgi:TolA-binding protein